MSKFDLNSFIGTPDVMKNAVQNIDINKLVPYKNHCFKLYEGERLDDMVRSVQQYGVMIPIIVRTVPDSNNYEILSGHNRVNAAKIAGKKNGVSKLHGAVSRELFGEVWPDIAANESPIGSALLGKKKNDIVEIKVPVGTVKYKILSITK